MAAGSAPADGYRGRPVLVTGADGFIGSHLVEALVRAGARVRAHALYTSFGTAGWLDSFGPELRGAFEIVRGDLRDPQHVRAAAEGAELVFHLGALIAIPYSYEAPRSYLDVNVGGTLNVLEAARACGGARVLQASTSEVYGTARTVPIDEEHPLAAQSPYAASKIAADQFALSFHRSYGLPVTVMRPFNVYGPRQSMRAVIPTVITQLVAGRQEIRLGTLDATRDFSYVGDTVAGMMALGLADAAVGEVVNIGSGFEISIGETAALIAGIVGSKAGIVLDPARVRPEASEVRRLLSSTAKLERLTAWRPEHGGLDGFRRGLEKTVAWFSEPRNLALHRVDDYVR